MSVAKTLVTLFTSSVLFGTVGCRYEEITEPLPFKDKIMKVDVTAKYEAALGLKGIYILDGEYKVPGKIAKAGTLLGYTSCSRFMILEFIEAYPQFSDDRVKLAAEKQAKQEAKRLKHLTSSSP